EDQRAPGADPIHVAVAVDVDQLAALTALDEDRVAPDLPHRPNRTVHPAGKDAQRAFIPPGALGGLDPHNSATSTNPACPPLRVRACRGVAAHPALAPL